MNFKSGCGSVGPTAEVHGSNPVIGYSYIEWLMSTMMEFEKTVIKAKRGREWPIFKISFKTETATTSFVLPAPENTHHIDRVQYHCTADPLN